MSDLDALSEEALKLDAKSRARLAEQLLASLDVLSEAEVEQLWADEAERRLRAYRAGQHRAIPADEVMREAERRLR